jgi:hypothetical protein
MSLKRKAKVVLRRFSFSNGGWGFVYVWIAIVWGKMVLFGDCLD